MISGWTRLPFEEVIEDCSAGSPKVLQSSYGRSGKLAVVDQGQELIAGYVDDEALSCRTDGPVIIFGDHTRLFKYVDFPFCLGADGVKVLRPKVCADVKFLYHYLRSLNIPEAGYSRHYKFLKRMSVLLPPLTEQRRIAAILDQAEALRAKRRHALAKLDTLTQSLFAEMFGDGCKFTALNVGEALKQGILVDVQDGNHGEIHPKASDFVDKGVPFITANCFVDDQIDTTLCHHLPDRFLKKLRIGFTKPHDVLLSHKGTIGNTAVVPEGEEVWILSPQVTYYRTDPNYLNPTFLSGYFRSLGFQRKLALMAEQSTRAYIGITRQQVLPLAIPPVDMQNIYARRIKALSTMRQKAVSSLKFLEANSKSLQHRAFRGEL